MRSPLPCIFLSFCLILFNLGFVQETKAQEMGKPILYNYSPRDYKASSANYMAVQDRRGLMYFANLRGILEFDGANWRVINIPNRSTVRSLATDSTGIVYVGAIGDFGFLQPDSMGRMEFVSLLPLTQIADPLRNNQVVVLGTEKGAYFHISGDTAYYEWKANKLIRYSLEGFSKGFSLFYRDQHLWVASPETGLAKLDEGKLLELDTAPLKDNYLLSLIEYDSDHYLALTNKLQFWLINKESKETTLFQTDLDGKLKDLYFSGIIKLKDGNFLVSTIRDGAILLNSEGKQIIQLNEVNGLQDRLILNAFEDRQGGVWLSLSKGITYLGMSIPLFVWDESNGLEGLVFSVNRFQGYLYASTAQGVFRLNGNNFEAVRGLNIETWQLINVELENGESRMLASTVKGLFQVEGLSAEPALKDKRFPFVGTLEKSSFQKGILYANDARQRLSVLGHKNGKWELISLIDSVSGRFEQIVEEAPGVLWLVERYGNQRAIRITLDIENGFELKEVQYFNEKENFPSILSIFPMRGKLHFFTEEGVYKIENGNAISKVQLPSLPRYGLTALTEDKQGRVYIRRMAENRSWFEVLMPDKQGGYKKDSVSLKELDNLDIWGQIYVEDQGKAWIGTSEGLYCFLLEKERKRQDFPLPIIRKVVLGEDSVLFYGSDYQEASDLLLFQEPKISHKNNVITFYYSAPYFGNSEATEYSIKLEGQDSEWSPWTSERKKDYTLLPPGTYEFLVKARNQFHQESGISAYSFTVSPPWWRSIWAFIVYGFIAMFLVYGTVKLNTQRLHLQNEHLERLVYERTNEIWEQHKEIVKKTVALKRKNEEIATQHDLLEDKNSELQDAMKKLQAAQTQLVESEKMASLGQLTAGIAHEINNPINYVKGNINPLKKDFEEIKDLFRKILQLRSHDNLETAVQQVESYVEEVDAVYLFQEMEQLLSGIEDGANRTKQIVDGLKIFSRTEHDLFKHIDIHKGIDSTLTLLNNRLKDRITVIKDYADVPVIECLPGKLNQVFMNIFVNSIQAIEKQAEAEGLDPNQEIGQITIKTEENRGCLPGKKECLKIYISDTGIGIPEKILNKIFDPFFTTKDVGEGTGLGLSITFGIIEKHHGRIKVESKEGEGTTFVITLPFKQEEDVVESEA